jgi:hypothetical protein
MPRSIRRPADASASLIRSRLERPGVADPWSALSAHVRTTSADPTRSLTLIVGAGVHACWHPLTSADRSAQRTLASWVGLLDQLLGTRDHHGLPPTLRWEMALLASTPPQGLPSDVPITVKNWRGKSAKAREAVLQRGVAQLLEHAEARVAQSDYRGMSALRTVLRSPVVSHVTSLNADRLTASMTVASEAVGDRARLVEKASRQWSVPRADGGALTIWHPHGDRQLASTLRFGIRRYSTLLANAEQMRGAVKAAERVPLHDEAAVTAMPRSWVEAMMTRPLLFVGSSLDLAEWGLWKVLVDRWRNHAKAANRKYAPPVWVLATPSSHCALPKGRLSRLEAPSWAEGWARLADCLTPATRIAR